ncbi:MAG: hypothetical protein RI987_854 [Actinomycetota bacterium]
MLVHILGIFFEFFAPLLGYLLFKGKGPFVGHHMRESLNFGITMVIAAIVLALSIVGWAIIWALPIYWTIFRIVAAYRASQGEFYRYPLTIRFVKA